ncbi:uncharacterized protein LOC122500706 [Leptopilina heterotoma]|uniref:uncharacterized protein LOC122500706 n=1 Tax=Leptopilina heterotoma TaxID=63436 RepID=UPI001CA9D9D6|nr:uncharacterized protein LOC122500706 [Leptopilina heterotoma]
MLNSRTVRLLIYSIGIVLLMSLKLVITENLGMSKLVTVDFEIYGRVQGVCFRKCQFLGVRHSISPVVRRCQHPSGQHKKYDFAGTPGYPGSKIQVATKVQI